MIFGELQKAPISPSYSSYYFYALAIGLAAG